MSNKEIAPEGFVIMNPLTGRPMEKTPSGIPLKDVTFKTKEELNKFVEQHWENPVFMTDGKNLELP
ncbi:hypothetical protein ACT3UJ_16760 [Halomonas sp. 86]|uniref:hypothetical protein n=1 Tax=unclassified Halomonas TaxID=2609666 RepID=UPI0040344A9D